MNDADLRGALADAARDIPEPDLAREAWRRGRRRDRWRVVGVLGGVVIATGVVVIAVAIVVPASDPAPDAVTTPSPRPSPSAISSPSELPTKTVADPELAAFYESVHTLPHLSTRDNAPTYVRDGRLWYGLYSMMQGIPGALRAQDVVVGRDIGWVVQLRRPDLVGGRIEPKGSTFQPFADQDLSNPDVFAASRDGKYIAMGDSLLNERGQRVGSLPPNIASTEAWTPVGLVYSDVRGMMWLWDPQSNDETPLPDLDDVNTDGWTITSTGNCSEVGRLRPSGTVETAFEHCGQPIVTLSPGWAPGARLALTADGEVYDTESGELVQSLDLPDGVTALGEAIELEYGGWWRGNVQNDVAPKAFFSFTVDLRRATDNTPSHRYEAIIVGCHVTTGDCGRLLSRPADSPGVPFVWR
ncbi:MAG TPA: hypothetical protein VFX15_02505 [Actinomycetes bacterium]|nr:hypothetical protein [Actinomycetes bacterium]